MNDTTNKEKQFDAAGKRRIVVDGIPYTVMVYFRSDAKETGLSKIMQLAKREIIHCRKREKKWLVDILTTNHLTAKSILNRGLKTGNPHEISTFFRELTKKLLTFCFR